MKLTEEQLEALRSAPKVVSRRIRQVAFAYRGGTRLTLECGHILEAADPDFEWPEEVVCVECTEASWLADQSGNGHHLAWSTDDVATSPVVTRPDDT